MKGNSKILLPHHHRLRLRHCCTTMLLSSDRCVAVVVTVVMIASLWFQGAFFHTSENNLATFVTNFQQRSLDIFGYDNEFAGREKEQRTLVQYDEFWLTESEQAYLPFDIHYTPSGENYGSLEPAWTETDCSAPSSEKNDDESQSNKKKIVFVHMVRTLGDALHNALASYASSCRAGIAYPGMYNIRL